MKSLYLKYLRLLEIEKSLIQNLDKVHEMSVTIYNEWKS